MQVRAELPAALATAIERQERPSLVFDLARIDANLAAIASATRGAGITALFAAKSFPHPAVHALAATHLAGFDVGSPGEIADVAKLASRGRSCRSPIRAAELPARRRTGAAG